jgi:hypothetical protein
LLFHLNQAGPEQEEWQCLQLKHKLAFPFLHEPHLHATDGQYIDQAVDDVVFLPAYAIHE